MKIKNQYIKILEYLVSINDHPYSINSGYLLLFETTIMGNTADLAMVQKRRRSLTPSTKRVSYRGSLLKGGLYKCYKKCCIKAY